MNILFEKGIIVLHRHKKSDDNFDNKFKGSVTGLLGSILLNKYNILIKI